MLRVPEPTLHLTRKYSHATWKWETSHWAKLYLRGLKRVYKDAMQERTGSRYIGLLTWAGNKFDPPLDTGG